MKIRTYFWHDRVISRPRMMVRRWLGRDDGRYFSVGNAGDLFGAELIGDRYHAAAVNDAVRGNRLLIVGSIAHRALSGDILAGPGLLTTARPVPSAATRLRIWGLRGPITYDAFKAAGHDLSEVKFLLDPGLLMRFSMANRQPATSRGVIFIPHHRERALHARTMPKGIRLVDIDARPAQIAEAILGAELVYASSLHGVIFAHALNRPCVLVQPAQQALLKYEDYFAAVGLPFPKPLPFIQDADFRTAPVSPADLSFREEDFIFPEVALLRDAGIAA